MTILRTDNRLVHGIAMPWNVEALKNFRRWKYLPGSIKVEAPISLLRDHDNSQRVGLIVSFQETEDGLPVTGWVRPSPAGDRALAVAISGGGVDEHGKPRPGALSAGLEEIKFEKIDGICVVRSAVLREVSIVKAGAFAGTGIKREEG